MSYMDIQKAYMQNSEEEIDLRDLFMALWNRKVMIIVITLVAALITGIFSKFVLSPVYHSKLNIVINMPETYTTKYGDYTLPITTNQQYINLITSSNIMVNTIRDMGYDSEVSIEDLRDRITVGNPSTTTNTEQNSFEVKVAADTPEEAKRLAEALYENYIEFMDVMVVEGAIEYFYNDYSVKIRSLEVEKKTNEELLAKNEALLAETPQTINQKEALNEVKQIKTRDYVVLENIINPNYTKVENDIITIKQTINQIDNSIELYNQYLKELEEEKEQLASYYQTGDYETYGTDIINVVKTNVYLPSKPVAPTRKSSPNNMMNVVIGAVLGGMVSVMIALVQEYWFKKERE